MTTWPRADWFCWLDNLTSSNKDIISYSRNPEWHINSTQTENIASLLQVSNINTPVSLVAHPWQSENFQEKSFLQIRKYTLTCKQDRVKTLLKIRTEVGKTRLYPISPSWVVFDPPAGCLRPFRSKIALILVSWPTGYNRPSRNADISWELDNWSSTSRWSNYNCPASPASAKFDKYQIFIFPTTIRNPTGQHQRLWKNGKRLGLKLEKEEERKILKIAAIKFRLGDSEVPAENTIWWSQNIFFGF